MIGKYEFHVHIRNDEVSRYITLCSDGYCIYEFFVLIDRRGFRIDEEVIQPRINLRLDYFKPFDYPL